MRSERDGMVTGALSLATTPHCPSQLGHRRRDEQPGFSRTCCNPATPVTWPPSGLPLTLSKPSVVRTTASSPAIPPPSRLNAGLSSLISTDYP